MEPSLKDGNRVQLRSSSWYWPGDVLVVRAGNSGLVAHRCIGAYRKKGEWRWLTQADSAPRPDRSVTLAGIFGKIVGGDCAPEIIRVPSTRRILAFWRFVRCATRRIIGARYSPARRDAD